MTDDMGIPRYARATDDFVVRAASGRIITVPAKELRSGEASFFYTDADGVWLNQRFAQQLLMHGRSSIAALLTVAKAPRGFEATPPPKTTENFRIDGKFLVGKLPFTTNNNAPVAVRCAAITSVADVTDRSGLPPERLTYVLLRCTSEYVNMQGSMAELLPLLNAEGDR